jgi:hypothetical protein
MAPVDAVATAPGSPAKLHVPTQVPVTTTLAQSTASPTRSRPRTCRAACRACVVPAWPTNPAMASDAIVQAPARSSRESAVTITAKEKITAISSAANLPSRCWPTRLRAL